MLEMTGLLILGVGEFSPHKNRQALAKLQPRGGTAININVRRKKN
jgi:hypothetical protein